MKSLLVLALALLASSAQAALPPGAESLRRIAAISSSAEVFKKIGSGGWVSQIKTEDGTNYIVISRDCALNVKVEVRNKDGIVGPGELVVIPGQVNCLPR